MRLMTAKHGGKAETADFPSFYTAHFGRIAGQLYAYLGDRSEAQDLTQEAFCRAFERWARISVYERPEAWVRQVAWNLATNRLRHLRVAMRYLARQRDEPVEGPTPDRVMLTTALAELPPKHRLAVVLHHMGQLSTAEIAQQQDVAEGTVRSWLSRGRTQLAEQLAEIPRNVPAIPAPGVDQAVARVHRRRAVRRATLAALIAIALAVPIAIILRAKGSEPPFIGPTTPPTIPTASPDPPSARQTLAQLALLAETAPVPPQPRSDQLILLTQIRYDIVGEHKQEWWLDPDGAILMRARSYEMGDLIDDQDEKDRQRWITDFRRDMEKVGPGLFYPNWTVLSTYPTDPRELLARIQPGRTYKAGELAKALGEMGAKLDMLAPPRLKAALLRTLTLIDGVTAEQITAPDGRRVWAIGGELDATRGKEILVSVDTGMMVGWRDLDMGKYIFPSDRTCVGCDPRQLPPASPMAPRVNHTIMFTSTLTAR